MQLGMPTLTENRSLEENICLCKDLGLQFIELNMNFPEYQLEAISDTQRLVRLAKDAGIYYTIHLDEKLDIADFNSLVSGAYLETVRRTIEASKELISLRDLYGDCSQPLILNMHMNHGVHITLPDRKVQMYDRNINEYLKAFSHFRTQCGKWIGDSEIMVAIENTDGFREYEKAAVDYLLESDKFGLTWDIGHSKAVGEKDVPYILSHRDKLVHFHVHDGTELPQADHLALGRGEINIAERLGTAKLLNCRCVLETKTVDALRESKRWLDDSHIR